MRLIDKDRLLSILEAKMDMACGEPKMYFAHVIGMVNLLPDVDAVPVVHGEWKEWWPPMHTIMTGEEMLYVCSACDAKYGSVEGYRYCPYCGAMMDGGADGETN